MKEYTSDKIRNVAVLSHDGAGKTAVVESLLLACGAVDAVGVGKDNKHIMDYEPEEIKRNVTIQLGIAPCEWEDHKLNFIDTPGYSEFCGEVRAALRASDGILLVVSAESGVEMDTERAWDYGVELKLPRMVYVNKMDGDNADYFGALEKMRAVFGKAIMPLQIPIGEGKDFRGIIDVCKMVAWEWKNGKSEEIKVPPEYMPKAREVREMCMEAAAEGDDELLEKYLNGDELTIEELRHGLRQGMLTGRVCPVMCGSAIHHIGTDELLRRIITYMPAASQKVMMGTNPKTDEPVLVYPDKPFTGFVFKTMIDPFAGKLSYVRIFSGELKDGDKLYNITQNKEEKLGKMMTLIGKEQLSITKAIAGDIVVIPKLANAKTGDTFATPDFPIIYDPVRFPNPLHTVAMVPEKKGEEEKLMNALLRISEEDPTCQVEKSVEGKQIVVHCMGDVHLEHIMTKMERKDTVETNLGNFLKGLDAMYGTTSELDYERGYAAVVNEPDQAELIASTARECFGDAAVPVIAEPAMTAEDYSGYLQKYKGGFFWLGATKPGAPVYPLHNAKFAVDEDCLPIGVELMASLVFKGLAKYAK